MKKELKIGVFVVVVIVVSFFVLNYLRGEDIFNREIELVSRYDNAEGLVASAPVYIKGYKAGKVSSVEYDPQTSDFKVTCSVSRTFRIPSDSKMVIYSVDIMGGKGVKIELGSSAETVADGGALVPCFEAGLMDALSTSIQPLLEKVGTAIDSLNTAVAGVNAMLSSSNRTALENTLAHLEVTMRNLRSLSGSINGKSAELEAFIDNVTAFSGKLDHLAEKVDTTMNGVGEFVGKLNASDVEGLILSFRNLLSSISDPNGSAGKLLKNDSVYNSVDSLLVDVNSLVDKIKENPKKYLKISVF